MNVIDRLQSSDGLTPTETTIARYVVENPEEATRISSRELARRTFTSATAVLRFCKKLGFSNYGNFKVHIVSDLKSIDLTSTIIADGESAIIACGKVAALEARVIEETKRYVSPETLDAIANRFTEAPYIDLFAFDTNVTMAEYASHNFYLAGRICTVYHEMDRMLHLAYNVPSDHTAVLISKSGGDRTLLATARMLKKSSVPLVAITANPDSALACMCDHTLRGFYYPEFDRFGDVVFGAAAKFLFDVLFVMVYSKDRGNITSLNNLYDRLYYRELDRSARRATAFSK